MHYRATVNERLAGLQAVGGGAAKRVTILGAGMAGLVAATELMALGHDVTLLEATGRPGGRVDTWRPKGSDRHHEFGAMRIPASHAFTRHYIRCAGLELRPFVSVQEDDYAWYFLRGNKFRMNDAGAHVPNLYELSFADRTKIAAINPQRQASERQTITGILMGQVVAPILAALTPADERALLLEGPATELSDRLEATTLGELVSQSLSGSDAADLIGVVTGLDVWWQVSAAPMIREELLFDSAPFDELSAGMDTLPQALADGLGDRIRYHRAVTAINVRENGTVALTTQRTVDDGDQPSYSKIDADADADSEVLEPELVLCTIPFGVLRGMRLTGLSAAKMAAIRTMNYASSTKVLLLCKKRRWEEEQIVGGATMSDTILRATYYPSDNHLPVSTLMSAGPVPNGTIYRTEHPMLKSGSTLAGPDTPGVLVASYSWGRDAQRMGALPHNERVKACLDVLERFHEGISTDVVDHASRCWDNHPWARGAFAMPHPNETSIHLPNGRRPEGCLYFAGEHLSFNPGWIQGAVISALDAVEGMLSA